MHLILVLIYTSIYLIAFNGAIAPDLNHSNSVGAYLKSKCKPTIQLKCTKGEHKRYTYYVYHEYADVKPGCVGNEIIKTVWSVISAQTKQMVFSATKSTKSDKPERSVTIPVRTAPAGKYVLQLVATETGGGQTTATCPFQYLSEPPVIIFQHGQLQYVLTGLPYTVDITGSKFHDEKNPKIIWKAKCSYVKKTEAICRKTHKCDNVAPMKGLKFVGVMNACFDDLTFIATINHPGGQVSATHVVTPRKMFSCKVDIICEKNCDKGGSDLSNPDLHIVLKIKTANLNCLGFESWRPEWVVRAATQLPASSLDIINDHKRMIIKERSLGFSETAAVVCVQEEKFESWFRLKTIPEIKKPDCIINPTSGKSMETKFSVTCVANDDHLKTYGPHYSVYQMVNGKKNLIISTADENFNMLLSSIKGQSSQQLVIEGSDIFHNHFECNVNAITVEPIELTGQNIRKNLESLAHLVEEGGPLAPQKAAALLNEVKQQDMDEKTKKTAKANIIKTLSHYNIRDMDTYKQVAAITASFVNVDNMSKKYQENLADLCKRLSTTHLKELHKSVYVKYQETDVKQQAKLNADCADKLLEPTKEDEAPPTTEATTRKDVEPVIKEDYPDYEYPFGNPSQEIIKTTGVDIITDSATSVAATLNAGENYTQETKMSTSLIAVEEGNFMASKTLGSGTITVIPTNDFKDEAENWITAIVSNYDRDVLTPASDLSSDIVEVKFYQNNQQVVKSSYDIQFVIFNATVPYDPYNVTTPNADDAFSQIDAKMNVHRLNLFAFESCLIRFKIAENIKFKVAVTVNQRPREHHFKDNPSMFTVDGRDETTWTINNPYPRSKRDTFFYVAVIPHGDMFQGNLLDVVPYEIQFSQIACVTYDKAKHNWVSAEDCNIKVTGVENATNVHCICTKTSLHSVYYKPIPNRLDEQILIDYTVSDFVNYVIYIHVITVFIGYAIALALMIKRPPKVFGRDKIIFLSDNLKNEKFCYMLVIRTGQLSSSGTTSNIMVQIFGSKATTQPHVLNYPDPACRLLQRDSVDWMILTNSVHLGNLETILLWTDGIGLYPAWYCQDITIFDLQTQKSYFFKVETWLSPLEKHVHYTRVGISTAGVGKTKERLDLVKHLRFYHTGRHTWNIFVRDDEELSYPERLTVILSMIYTTYMVVIWLLGPPTLSPADSFGYGEFQFYTEIAVFAFVSSILCSIIHMPLVYFLRNSKRSDVSIALVVSIKPYSFKTRRLLWYLLIGWLILCLLYLLTFSFWVTDHSVYLWVFITILSLVTSIFIWENLFIIGQNIITSHIGYTEQLVYNFEAIIIEIEHQRKVLFKKFGEVLMRPYFRKHYRLLSPNELFNLKHGLAKRIEVAHLFKDMCLFLVFIGILYLISIMQYNSYINYSNKMMHRMVQENIYGGGTNLLDDIDKTEDIYDYIEYVIIPTIHPTKWYGKWYASDAGQLADFATRILGVVQLRQQRRSQVCKVPHALSVLKIPCSNEAPVFENWEYHDGTGITSTVGHFKIYDGSGYIANLGRTLKNSMFILNLLRGHKWIDINTAVLFIDFLTYNANLNVFNAVRIIIERSPTGRIRTSSQIFTTSLIYTDYYLEIFVAFLLILLTIVIIVMFVKRLVQFVSMKGAYFKSFWNVLDLILALLSISLIILFFLRKQAIENLLRTIAETNHNQFVSYYHLIILSEAATFTYGILLSLSTLRLWKFLHFGVLFRIMERTILRAGPQLLGLFLYQIIIYLTMVSFIYPIYGDNMHEFRDYYSALVKMYLSSINFTEHLPNVDTTMHNSFLYLMYSIYLIVSLCFLNSYATALIINLEESKIYYSNATHLYSIHTYVMDVFHFYKEKWRRHLESTRLKGGGSGEEFQVDVDKLVYPKSQEHRYADLVTMNKQKMNLMRDIAILAAKNIAGYGKNEKISEKDYELMANIVVSLIKTNDGERERLTHIFYPGRDLSTGQWRFVPDARLLQIEIALKKMLEGKVEEVSIVQDMASLVLHQSGTAKKLEQICESLKTIQKTINHIIVKMDRNTKPERIRKEGEDSR